MQKINKQDFLMFTAAKIIRDRYYKPLNSEERAQLKLSSKREAEELMNNAILMFSLTCISKNEMNIAQTVHEFSKLTNKKRLDICRQALDYKTRVQKAENVFKNNDAKATNMGINVDMESVTSADNVSKGTEETESIEGATEV